MNRPNTSGRLAGGEAQELSVESAHGGRERVPADSKIKLCLFSSTPDIAQYNFIVKVLTGSPMELAQRAVEWGYDGFEFMPDPDRVVGPREIEQALEKTGAIMPVVNSGRIGAQGMALLHEDEAIRARSIRAFKEMLNLAGHFGARVGLGMARGRGIPGTTKAQMDALAHDVFRELADHACKAGAVIMLEAADPGVTAYINTMEEAMTWVDRIDDPHFGIMLDTYQLSDAEPSVEYGIRAARGRANHIHLYDPSRLPPGAFDGCDRLDWETITRVLREEGFVGTGSVVLAPEGDPRPPARKAAAYLRKMFSAA